MSFWPFLGPIWSTQRPPINIELLFFVQCNPLSFLTDTDPDSCEKVVYFTIVQSSLHIVFYEMNLSAEMWNAGLNHNEADERQQSICTPNKACVIFLYFLQQSEGESKSKFQHHKTDFNHRPTFVCGKNQVSDILTGNSKQMLTLSYGFRLQAISLHESWFGKWPQQTGLCDCRCLLSKL